MRWRLLALVVVLVLVLPGAAYGLVQGEPDIRVFAPENTVSPGEAVEFTLQVQNDPEISQGGESEAAIERITTARGVRVTLEDGAAPVEVKTDTVGIGTLPQGQTEVPFQLVIPEDAEPGTYELPVEVEYTYTNMISETAGIHQERTRTERTDVTLVIEEGSRFRVVDTHTDVGVGGRGVLEMTLENVGEETAHDASVVTTPNSQQVVLGGGPSGESFIGEWDPGDRRTVTYDVQVSPEATARNYGLETVITFEDGDGLLETSNPLRSGIVPAPKPRFVVTAVDSNAQVGERGTVDIRMTNVGGERVEDASIVIEPNSEELRFGGGPVGETFVGAWDAGETRTMTYDVAVSPDAVSRNYGFEAIVQYHGGEGTRVPSDPAPGGLTPAPEQRFSYRNVESDLMVDRTGSITGEVVNEGPETARNVVVRFAHEGPNIHPREVQYAVGTLEPDEAAPFEFFIDVGAEAEPVARQFDLHTRYRTADGDLRIDEDNDVRVDVQPEADEFGIDVVDTEIPAGSDRVIAFEVTNNRDEPVENVRAKLFTDSPLDSDDDEAFVDRLEAGESTTLTFELSADAGATPKTQSISIDFRFDDDRGDTRLSEAYLVPVTIVPEEGGLVPTWALVLVLILLAAGGVWWWRSR